MPTESDIAVAFTEAAILLRSMLVRPRAAMRQIRGHAWAIRVRFMFRGAEIGEHLEVTGRVRLVTEGRISIGDCVRFLGGMISSELVCHPSAELVIGANCQFNYGVTIESTESVRIGRRCLFGSMTSLRDSDLMKRGPVVLEDDVWVAHGAVIQPGVRIGAGSIVSAGSVVRSDVPPDSIAIGNPAECFPLGSEEKSSHSTFFGQNSRP
ncbi:MAG: acyltransferase [Polyangiaceae bacterium]|jgi:maltose O-acetyltransferase